MFIFPGRKILALALSVALVFGAVLCCAPPQAQADTIDDVVAELQKVYNWLDKDPDGKNAVATAKTNLSGLAAKDINTKPWPDVFNILITQEVKNQLSSKTENDIKDEIKSFICGLANLTYSSSSPELRNELEGFRENYRQTVTDFFGTFTIDDLYNYLIAAKEKAPDALTSLSVQDLENIASGNYTQIRDSVKNWMREALIMADTNNSFSSKLSAIGWSIDKLVEAKDLVSAEVDPGYNGEIALLKAYVRSETKFIKDGSYLSPDQEISMYVVDTLDLKLSVLGYNFAGSVLKWAAKNPDNPAQDSSVVSVDNVNKKLTASAAGKALIIAYNTDPDTNWAYKGIVNVSTRPSGGGGGDAGAGPTPTPVPVITLPTEPEKANQEVQKHLSDLVQLAASDPARAAEQLASLIQTIVQAKVELAAETKEQFVKTITTVLQAAGQLPEKAVQEIEKGNYVVNEQAALAQVEQLVKVWQILQQAIENLNKATGAGIQAPPPPVLTVQAKELSTEGKAQVTIPAAVTAKLSEAIPEAAVRINTPAGALVLPATETAKAAGDKGTLQAGFKETAVSSVNLPGGRLVSKAVDVTVTASSDAGTRTIASFTRPVQLFIPYNKGQVLNPDALGVYKLLEGGQVKFVGGKVLPDGTVGAQLKSLSAYTVLEYSKTFADLAGHWAKKDVEKMASRHVARGISETQFAPDADVTRAQFAALLIRTLGIDEAAPTGTIFSDVPKGAWYAGAVETAYAHQLVSGMGGGLFAPDEKITREQMAAMITRALKAAGKPVTLTQAQIAEVLKAYADRAEVSPWATQAMAEAISAGIVKGRAATTLVPQGTATRAEAVVMLKRLIDAAGIY